MFSIGEFSKITGLTVKTLRFYHEQSLLAQAQIDNQTGYRYYDDRQIETASLRNCTNWSFRLPKSRNCWPTTTTMPTCSPFWNANSKRLPEKRSTIDKLNRGCHRIIQIQREAKTP